MLCSLQDNPAAIGKQLEGLLSALLLKLLLTVDNKTASTGPDSLVSQIFAGAGMLCDRRWIFKASHGSV